MLNKVVIVDALRSPIGSFGGVFEGVSAIELGKQVLQALLKDKGIAADAIDEVIIGNVLGAGLGQNIARQIAIQAGLDNTTSAFTVNKVCGSGLKSILLGAQAIQLGEAEIVIAGGTENMSQAPYIAPGVRWGAKMGNQTLIDTLLKDGLTDSFDEQHMGITAERLAEQYHISREEQDAFALESQRKAQAAQEEGRFESQIVPIEVPKRRGKVERVAQDEYPRHDLELENLAALRPVFDREGSVTAGNASGINDGAALVLLMSEEKAKALGLTPLATLLSYATAGVDPKVMGLGPVPASLKALEKATLTMASMDLIEANEAFASQALAVSEELAFNKEKVNVNGGAIALGHPIGASGARILVTLLHELKRSQKRYGLATLCIGGGQGIAMVVEA